MTVTQRFHDDRRDQDIELIYDVADGIYTLRPASISLMDLVPIAETVH